MSHNHRHEVSTSSPLIPPSFPSPLWFLLPSLTDRWDQESLLPQSPVHKAGHRHGGDVPVLSAFCTLSHTPTRHPSRPAQAPAPAPSRLPASLSLAPPCPTTARKLSSNNTSKPVTALPTSPVPSAEPNPGRSPRTLHGLSSADPATCVSSLSPTLVPLQPPTWPSGPLSPASPHPLAPGPGLQEAASRPGTSPAMPRQVPPPSGDWWRRLRAPLARVIALPVLTRTCCAAPIVAGKLQTFSD